MNAGLTSYQFKELEDLFIKANTIQIFYIKSILEQNIQERIRR